MHTPPLFPLPDPPAESVAFLLDELRDARRELADARRIVHMLTVDPGAQPRARIERDVALLRVELWRDVVEAREERARVHGLDVASIL